MRKYFWLRLIVSLTVILGIIPSEGRTQDMKAYEGHWEAVLPEPGAFRLAVKIGVIDDSTASFTLSGTRGSVSRTFHFVRGHPFVVSVDSSLSCKGVLGKGLSSLRVFIQSGQWQYHMVLQRSVPGQFSGEWNILLVDEFHSPFYLSIENPNGEQYEAYAFSSEHRFPGFFCYNYTKQADSIHFNDFRTGVAFSGKLLDKSISFAIKMAGISLAEIVLRPSPTDWALDEIPPIKPFQRWAPLDMQDGLAVGDLREAGFKEAPLQAMVDSIHTNQITRTQSVLISRKGRLVYEQYFEGFDAATPHDTRSASKSISSALIGIAIDKGILKDTGQKLFDLLPPSYRYAEKSDVRKKAISIGDLLTMSSGLDAIDFGIERRSAASEDVYQQTPDWLKTVVEAPMINQPGSHANYSSANPFLLGVVLNTQLGQPMEFFMDDNLFGPLGIDDYLVQSDCFGKPYFGGGMLLRPRDLLKFGLLYAQKGVWNHRRIISEEWVKASFFLYRALENHPEKNEYGFLWWHYIYRVGGKTIHSIEARGAGGQYIFIIPEYEVVAVVTSANFRNGRVWQPEKIMENYILPALQ